MLSGLPAENIHLFCILVSTSNVTQEGECQHLKQSYMRKFLTATVFVFLTPLSLIHTRLFPVWIFQHSSTTHGNATEQIRLLEAKLLPLEEGKANLTEVNILLKKKKPLHLPIAIPLFPYSPSYTRNFSFVTTLTCISHC